MNTKITILIARRPGASLAKRFHLEGVENYSKAKTFDVEEAEVDGLNEFAGLLRDLSGLRDRCIIRGQLKEGVTPRGVLRRLKTDDAPFTDAPRPWLCLDIDDMPLTHLAPRDDPQALAHWIVGRLPSPLNEASCVVQWSQSAGVPPLRPHLASKRSKGLDLGPYASCHIWFWLTAPASAGALRAQVRQWQSEAGLWLTPCLCNPIQIHYTAAPLFSDGLEDPLPGGRIVLCQGMDEALDLEEVEDRWSRARAEEIQRLRDWAPDVDLGLEWKRAVSALEVADPDCDMNTWLAVGMGLKTLWPESGLALWASWSAKGEKVVEGECAYRYGTFGAAMLSSHKPLGALIRLAQASGWEDPWPHTRAQMPHSAEARADWSGDKGDPGEPPRGWGEGVLPPKPPSSGGGGDDPPGDEPPREVRSGKQRFVFGELVWQFTTTDEGQPETGRLLARRIWPQTVVQDVDTGIRGLLYRFCDQDGHERQMVMPAEAWIDKSPARRAAEEAARAGVAIEPCQGVAFVIAMGRWASDTSVPFKVSVSTWGWRRRGGRWVYTAAPETFGAPWVWSGVKTQTERSGALSEWLSGCESAAAGSKAMTLALAVAFGGALVEPLGQGSFMVHLFGGSSTGKTIAALVGASVWSDPKRPASWKDTGSYLLEMLPHFSGRCMTIDDLRKAGYPKSVASLVLALSDNLTKGRLNRDGQRQLVHRFALSVLSSGEQSMGAYLGALDDVGHGVRCIDVPIELGDSTHDRSHAKKSERWLGSTAYGVAGPAFARHLVERLSEPGGLEAIAQVVERHVNDTARLTGGHATNDRIAGNLALCAASLELAQQAEIAPQTGVSPTEMLMWVVSRVCTERGREVSPEERCLVELMGRVTRQPQSYPTALQYQQVPPRDFSGLHEPTDRKLYVTEALIKPLCEDMRVSPRTWLRWLAAKGYSSPPPRSFRLGQDEALNQRWHTLDLSRCRGGVP